MKTRFPLVALAFVLGLLTSCGGETGEQEPEKPGFAETKSIPNEDAKEEPKSSEEEDEEAEKERRRLAAEERGKKWFEDKDIDGDGALTQEESGNMAWVFLHQADTDGDGAVTGDEVRTMMVERRFKRPEPSKVIEIMDTDGDGMIGSAEIPERMRAGIGFADTDGDGSISVLEIEVLNARMDAGGFGGFGRPGGGPPGGGRPGGSDGDGPGL